MSVTRLNPTSGIEKVYNRLRFRGRYGLRRLVPALTPEQSELVARLGRDGFVQLDGFISAPEVALLQQEFDQALNNLEFEMPCLAQSKVDPVRHKKLLDNHMYATNEQLREQGLAIDRKDAVSIDQVVRDFNPSTLTVYMLERSARYRKLWLDPRLLTIVSAYLGLVPHLAEAYVRRNYPSPFRTMNHYWHRDLNSRHYLVKIFFFLSDCTVESGPHEFVRGSHRSYDVLNSKVYYTDEEVNDAYPSGGAHRVVSEVKAGTVIIEDTRGLHRARMPDAGQRDLGYAVFVPFLPGREQSYYRFPRAACDSLSEFQKSFIPEVCLT